MSKWLTIGQIPLPAFTPGVTIPADDLVAMAVYGDLRAFAIQGIPSMLASGPQYANPQAYLTNTIAYAQTLARTAPLGWNPVASAVAAVMTGFSVLSQLPVNASDPYTVSLMQAWVSGTGSLYGGHAPVQTPTGTAATGQSAAPPGSDL